jgi:hypothetical protein
MQYSESNQSNTVLYALVWVILERRIKYVDICVRVGLQCMKLSDETLSEDSVLR